MKQEFFSGVAEVLSRVVSLVLVLVFYVIFFLGRGSVALTNLVSQGTLILGGIILYELLAFVFFELFSFAQDRVLSRPQDYIVSENSFKDEPILADPEIKTDNK